MILAGDDGSKYGDTSAADCVRGEREFMTFLSKWGNISFLLALMGWADGTLFTYHFVPDLLMFWRFQWLEHIIIYHDITYFLSLSAKNKFYLLFA